MPFSVVRQIQNIHIRSLVLIALQPQFLLFLRIMTSTTCPYYRVQRCIPFHQFHMIYGVLLLLNWHGPDRSADTVKGKARYVDSRIIALIWKQSASTPTKTKVLYYFYPISTSIITLVLFHANIYWFYQSLVYKCSATVISCNKSRNLFIYFILFFSIKGTLF